MAFAGINGLEYPPDPKPSVGTGEMHQHVQQSRAGTGRADTGTVPESARSPTEGPSQNVQLPKQKPEDTASILWQHDPANKNWFPTKNRTGQVPLTRMEIAQKLSILATDAEKAQLAELQKRDARWLPQPIELPLMLWHKQSRSEGRREQPPSEGMHEEADVAPQGQSQQGRGDRRLQGCHAQYMHRKDKEANTMGDMTVPLMGVALASIILGGLIRTMKVVKRWSPKPHMPASAPHTAVASSSTKQKAELVKATSSTKQKAELVKATSWASSNKARAAHHKALGQRPAQKEPATQTATHTQEPAKQGTHKHTSHGKHNVHNVHKAHKAHHGAYKHRHGQSDVEVRQQRANLQLYAKMLKYALQQQALQQYAQQAQYAHYVQYAQRAA